MTTHDDPRSLASKSIRKRPSSSDPATPETTIRFDPNRTVACPVRVVLDARVELAEGTPISLGALATRCQLAGQRWQINPVGVIDPDDTSTWQHLLDVPRLPSRVTSTFGEHTQFARFPE